MNMFVKFFGLILLLSCTSSAHAQWTKDVDSDPFTEEIRLFIKNEGTVLEGPQGKSSLVYRTRTDESPDLYWVTPVPYICPSKPIVMARFGKGKPVEVPVSVSTSNESIFFYQPWHILHGSNQGRILLKLTDTCGNSSVIKFTGTPKEFLPDLNEFSKLDNWTLDTAGYVVTTNENSSLKYRKMNDGSDDLGVHINLPYEINRRKRMPKIILKTSRSSYPTKVYDGRNGFRLDKDVIFDLNIYLNDKTELSNFVDEITSDGMLTVIHPDGEMIIDLRDFDIAKKLG